MANVDFKSLMGHRPTSELLRLYLSQLAAPASSGMPDVKTYSDVVYFSYFSLGVSLVFDPVDGHRFKPGSNLDQLDQSKLQLRGIDIYNVPKQKPSDKTRRDPSNQFHSPYPVSPIIITLSARDKDGKSRAGTTLEVTSTTTGKDFVLALGEPDRKGGGSGPSSGSIGIWLEWTRHGVMVEFGGDESRGPQAWEKGKDATWSVLSIFSSL
ncbi:hypothetical protein K488DRAFT_40802 [Vararia minispora EC-137]|uniref:Uncharacterized protein n=1 Tax=Vararia minispora EC-137 TaxID=1314806 RepID=A0ACB8QYA9_9AGAM|nr:hypothetical protein K488DRAFT_40802 [Vararia minispora EC-137]